MKSTLIATFALPLLALAKTDLAGCTSSKTIVYGGASMVYWDPTNGEICQFLDCGGGRAPPKTTVPGCPQYAGTETYSPSYLPGWGSATPTGAASSAASVTGSSSAGSASASASASQTGGSTLVTSAPSLPASSAPVAVGTGGLASSASVSGANNVTGSATLSSPSVPESTGGAARFGLAQGVVGVVAGVFGLAML